MNGSAAAGVTSVAWAVAGTYAPLITGIFLSALLWSWPFYLAGILKLIDDISLSGGFRALRPLEEKPRSSP